MSLSLRSRTRFTHVLLTFYSRFTHVLLTFYLDTFYCLSQSHPTISVFRRGRITATQVGRLAHAARRAAASQRCCRRARAAADHHLSIYLICGSRSARRHNKQPLARLRQAPPAARNASRAQLLSSCDAASLSLGNSRTRPRACCRIRHRRRRSDYRPLFKRLRRRRHRHRHQEHTHGQVPLGQPGGRASARDPQQQRCH